MRKVVYITMNGIFDTLKEAKANVDYLVDIVDTTRTKEFTQADLDEIAKRRDGLLKKMAETA